MFLGSLGSMAVGEMVRDQQPQIFSLSIGCRTRGIVTAMNSVSASIKCWRFGDGNEKLDRRVSESGGLTATASRSRLEAREQAEARPGCRKDQGRIEEML